MAEYQQKTITGESRVRSHEATIVNPLSGQGRSITFFEEKILTVDGASISTKLGQLTEPLTPDNLTELFDLLHPDTGEVIGAMRYADVQVALHSLYYHLAHKRDAAQAAS